MPDADPQPGDLYMASPRTSFNGDAHGDNARPFGVAKRNPRVAICVNRTTNPEKDARTIPSPAKPELNLVDAYWQSRFHRTVHRKWWGTDDFRYLDRLPTTEAADLARFFAISEMLGEDNR